MMKEVYEELKALFETMESPFADADGKKLQRKFSGDAKEGEASKDGEA